MAGSGTEYNSENQGKPGPIIRPRRWRKTIVADFQDVAEIIDFGSQSNSPWLVPPVSRRPNWGGTATWEEAIDLARFGWREGRDKVTRGLFEKDQATYSYIPKISYDFAGSHPNVPRFVGGDLECMFAATETIRAQRPIVKLVVNMVTGHATPESHVTNWGAAIVGWIDEMEAAGIRVEVVWASYSMPSHGDLNEDGKTGGPRVLVTCVLKAADQPVDIDRLAFWIMHPAAQRRIQFSVKEQFDIKKWYYPKYGWPDYSDDLKQHFDSMTTILHLREGAQAVQGGIEMLREHFKALSTADR